ncbi:hypothetical protein, partial [Marinagarivorans algicola]
MIKKLVISTMVVMSFHSSSVLALSLLKNSLMCSGGSQGPSQPEWSDIGKLADIFSLANIDTGANCIAWLNIPETPVWYELSENLNFYKVDINTDSYIGAFPIDSFSESTFLVAEEIAAAEKLSHAVGESYPEISNANDLNIDSDPSYYFSSKVENNYGCIQANPLRYEVINDEGLLVLLMADQMILFSASADTVIFSSILFTSDQVDPVYAAGETLIKGVDGEPQYIADSGFDKLVREVMPARKSFAKHYFGSFSGANNKDVLIWRKAYESKLRSDTSLGFELQAQKLLHYLFVNGVYKL